LKGKIRQKKKPKFKILLDSSFGFPRDFPKLSAKCNVAHPISTFRLSPQISDEDLYQLAIREDRFMLTINLKDFKKLVKPKRPGIICIESQLTSKQIDDSVAEFLSRKNPTDYFGKVLKVPHEVVVKWKRK